MKKTTNKNGLTLAELAEKVSAKLIGDGAVRIYRAAPIASADEGEISFVANKKYNKLIETTKASALVLGEDAPKSDRPTLIHKNPYLTFARIVDLLYPDQPLVAAGIHQSAIIEAEVEIDKTAGIGPHCHIRNGAKIGSGSQLVSDIYVGHNVSIGCNCLFYPGVRIMDDCHIGDNVIIHASTVIGSDGFGFAESETGLKKIKQVGWVEIKNDVEIGSNVSVDRGAIGPTVIGQGTKIDNLVQIAHNVEIGAHSIIVAQVGISGSTKIGNGVILAGQAGLVGHIEIGDGARVGAQSGVPKSIPPGKTVFGSPAREIMESKRIEACLTRLPELLKRVKKLEEK